MIYLDHGATSYPKPPQVAQAMLWALQNCANPGRGGHRPAMLAAQKVLNTREIAGELFECNPENVVFTGNCTQGLNMAIHTLVKPGSRVIISGFEHNAVTRPVYARTNKVTVAGRRLFDWEDTLKSWEQALQKGADAAIFTHTSNVFGYILPAQQLSDLCRRYGVPFIVDAAQSAGVLPVSLKKWGADFIAMPGHKGLLGPQGTGILLCSREIEPLIQGGTGSRSIAQIMPDFLPDAGEAGTVNVPGIAGLGAGLVYLKKVGVEHIFARECRQAKLLAKELEIMGVKVFSGDYQGGTVSFVPKTDCEEVAQMLAEHGVCVRAGLHCAPLAHESAGTLQSGTVRVSFGHDANDLQRENLLKILKKLGF